MRLPSKTTGFSLLFVLTLGISLYLMFTSDINVEPTSIDKNSPDAYSQQLNYLSHTATGLIANILTSKLAVHYPAADITTFKQPKLTYYTQTRQRWIVTSEKGESLRGHKKILLTKNVVIHQPQSSVVPDTKIYTQHLTVFPGTDTAITHDPVKIVRPGTIIHGIGMTANLKTGQYKLLRHARGTYIAEA